MNVLDSIVVGAGQAGLAASYHLRRREVDHVVLDANSRPGGAWQHRWDSLTMRDVHGVADLPGAVGPPRTRAPSNEVIPAYFAQYERDNSLPVMRPVRVRTVSDAGDHLVVHAEDGRRWATRTLVNATGTWTRPFVPTYPGASSFRGKQFHTVTYPGREWFRGRRVAVVGAGASAVQFIGELAPVASTLWITRRPPLWRHEGFDVEHGGRFEADAGLAAVTRVAERNKQGLPPASVVSATGLALRPQEQAARELGAYEHPRTMFSRVTPTGLTWKDGTHEKVDAILWATGFRAAISHLASLHLRGEGGGVELEPVAGNVQGATRSVADPRINLVGYGPSASTIGAGRAGRTAAASVVRYLAEH